MAGTAYRLTRGKVKKAIKAVEKPTWAELARALECHHFTVQRFLQYEENKDLSDLLQERRGNIDILAVNLIEDKILAGDEKLALKWLDFKHKREMGNTIKVEGDLELKIIIEDTKDKK